jgi:hypothetical protein
VPQVKQMDYQESFGVGVVKEQGLENMMKIA